MTDAVVLVDPYHITIVITVTDLRHHQSHKINSVMYSLSNCHRQPLWSITVDTIVVWYVFTKNYCTCHLFIPRDFDHIARDVCRIYSLWFGLISEAYGFNVCRLLNTNITCIMTVIIADEMCVNPQQNVNKQNLLPSRHFWL